MCDHDQCHVKCILEEGRLVATTGMPRAFSPFQPWYRIEQCPKQMGIVEHVYHPMRLSFPLRRAGERGENRWKRITWNQALDEIAEKLKEIKEKYGPEALGILYGFYNEQWDAPRFANLYGTPNIDSVDARVCGAMEAFMNVLTYGGIAHYGPPDPKKTKLLVLWANRPSMTNPIKWDRGYEVPHFIVIDPRYTNECARADMWLQIRPGTDAALALGWLNVIINEELYDKDFVAKWTMGFDRLRERVQEYSPERVEEITWIPGEDIIKSARMYATMKPAYIQWGSPTGYCGLNAAETERTRCILRAITGNLEVEGGNQIFYTYSKQVKLTELELAEMIPEEQIRKSIGSDRFRAMMWPGYQLLPQEVRRIIRKSVVRGGLAVAILNAARTGKPYPIKAIICAASNIMATMPDTKHVYEAIENTELFVVLETFMTPTGALADYLLPMTMWLERPQYSFLEHRNCILAGQRVLQKTVPGEYDRRDDYDFWRGLGIRLGQGEHWPWKSLEEVYDYRLKPAGMTWEEFSERKLWDCEPLRHKWYEKTRGFLTPSGKVEIYSSILEKLGYDPLPHYEEPPESPIRTPELAEEYPYILINRKARVYLHSEMRMIETQRRMVPDPVVEINPETAKKHNIEEGDWVWIETRWGKIKQRCKYHEIDPRVVCAEFGWWYPEKPAEEPSLFGVWESNVNVVTSDNLDYCGRTCGNWYLTPYQCRISKVK